MKIGLSGTFCLSKNIILHFCTNPNANWTYGQSIENCDTPPLRPTQVFIGLVKATYKSEDRFPKSINTA